MNQISDPKLLKFVNALPETSPIDTLSGKYQYMLGGAPGSEWETKRVFSREQNNPMARKYFELPAGTNDQIKTGEGYLKDTITRAQNEFTGINEIPDDDWLKAVATFNKNLQVLKKQLGGE